MHYLHNNVLVIDQSEYIQDRPVPGPFPAFPMTKREKPWERGWFFWLICAVILSFGEKSWSGGPPPENVYICEALGLNFWRFPKQICKQIACKLIVFHKNNYFIMQILPENVKILTWILHDFCLNFTVGGSFTPPSHTPRSLRPWQPFLVNI